MKRLSLGIRPYATDVTACSRCGNPVLLRNSWPLLGGGRICPDCVAEAVEAHQLATATDHELPS
ncbi:unnamed protein product [[Actinomadura] parvosata subsp. kistnae]|uniref:ClpX-type ZB domain-containing protein n=1 Tax=[Actinomadura] parvosata subsp. kistnae TaxID=1909395 RepID=A0A1U9ZYC6_9ACTN|nr:hypothetical protein [Nonomuraea sp. ATCC 55076]AQZ62919.1 hypothetical protein BKM31_16930 [Nonomuraea sp. ATCC 55076]SPL95810.1 unnamed protein product [Actinomadura parvosata subsp. kistnae]